MIFDDKGEGYISFILKPRIAWIDVFRGISMIEPMKKSL